MNFLPRPHFPDKTDIWNDNFPKATPLGRLDIKLRVNTKSSHQNSKLHQKPEGHYGISKCHSLLFKFMKYFMALLTHHDFPKRSLMQRCSENTINDKIVRVKHLFGLYSPLAPQYNVDYCHNNILKQHNDFYCKRYPPKATLLMGEGRGAVQN